MVLTRSEGIAIGIQHHGAVDEVIVVRKGWLKSLRHIRQLRQHLRQRQFEWSIDPQSLTKSSMAAWLSGARRRIGFKPPQGRELSRWCNNIRVARTAAHVVRAYLQLLTPLGIVAPQVHFGLQPHLPSTKNRDSFLADKGLNQYAVVNPGAGWDSKIWPADRYAKVVAEVGRRSDIPWLVTWAGPREREMAQQIVKDSGGHAHLAPDTDLLSLTAYLQRASFYLGSDTGPTHLAAAVGTPCAAIYGPTRPEDCGPWGSQHQILQRYCGEGDSMRRSDNRAMCAVDVDEVVQACLKLREPRAIAA